MNIGQATVLEITVWIVISLLAFIAILMLVLIGKVRQLIDLLREKQNIPAAVDANLAAAAGIPEEDLAVIMAVMAQILPEIDFANIQIKPGQPDEYVNEAPRGKLQDIF